MQSSHLNWTERDENATFEFSDREFYGKKKRAQTGFTGRRTFSFGEYPADIRVPSVFMPLPASALRACFKATRVCVCACVCNLERKYVRAVPSDQDLLWHPSPPVTLKKKRATRENGLTRIAMVSRTQKGHLTKITDANSFTPRESHR